MFHLDPGNVEKLEPGKKPSTTLSPSLVMSKGAPYMAFGTPGTDQQDQWTLQFFLNYLEFGMNLQKALDAPTVHTLHFPSSFWPHDLHPGVVAAESRIDSDVLAELRKKGHRIVIDGAWSHGRCLAIHYDSETHVISGAASPRPSEAYALGW
jgi:gamma-glutamyltranspeptidase/glutathione hydrolase